MENSHREFQGIQKELEYVRLKVCGAYTTFMNGISEQDVFY